MARPLTSLASLGMWIAGTDALTLINLIADELEDPSAYGHASNIFLGVVCRGSSLVTLA